MGTTDIRRCIVNLAWCLCLTTSTGADEAEQILQLRGGRGSDMGIDAIGGMVSISAWLGVCVCECQDEAEQVLHLREGGQKGMKWAAMT